MTNFLFFPAAISFFPAGCRRLAEFFLAHLALTRHPRD
jgi:hypothetical protein